MKYNFLGVKGGIQIGVGMDDGGKAVGYATLSGDAVGTAKGVSQAMMGPLASQLKSDIKPSAGNVEGGLTGTLSNASSVADLAGWDTYQSITAADGASGTVEHSSGDDEVTGTNDAFSVTVGLGEGGGFDAGVSYTTITPAVEPFKPAVDGILKPTVQTTNKLRDGALSKVMGQYR